MAKKSPAGERAVEQGADSKPSAVAKASTVAKAMADKMADKAAGARRPSPLVDTRVVYCGDNLEQL